jgi:hypothetical protein
MLFDNGIDLVCCGKDYPAFSGAVSDCWMRRRNRFQIVGRSARSSRQTPQLNYFCVE